MTIKGTSEAARAGGVRFGSLERGFLGNSPQWPGSDDNGGVETALGAGMASVERPVNRLVGNVGGDLDEVPAEQSQPPAHQLVGSAFSEQEPGQHLGGVCLQILGSFSAQRRPGFLQVAAVGPEGEHAPGRMDVTGSVVVVTVGHVRAGLLTGSVLVEVHPPHGVADLLCLSVPADVARGRFVGLVGVAEGLMFRPWTRGRSCHSEASAAFRFLMVRILGFVGSGLAVVLDM